MSATAASAAASSAAIAATIAANNARKVACSAIMANYTHATATTEQARQYAECVNLTMPVTLDPASILLIKILIVCTFLSAGVGAVYGWQDDGLGMAALGALMGACAFAVFAFAIGLVCYGISFLVTA